MTSVALWRKATGVLTLVLLSGVVKLVAFGPTAVNMTPARFLFVTSPQAKARLVPLMSEGNRAKTQQAPVNLILAQDLDFHDHLPTLFPHAPGARDWFADEAGRRETAFRNASLQGGYLTIAARALGLDAARRLCAAGGAGRQPNERRQGRAGPPFVL